MPWFRRRYVAAFLVLALGLALSPVASAAPGDLPRGSSAVDQYLEAIPTSSGSASSRPSQSRARSNLTQRTAYGLLRRGKDGQTALSVAFATRQQQRLPAAVAAPAPGSAGSVNGASAPSGVFDAITGSGEGLDVWLPVLLVVIALSGLLAALRRRLGRQDAA